MSMRAKIKLNESERTAKQKLKIGLREWHKILTNIILYATIEAGLKEDQYVFAS